MASDTTSILGSREAQLGKIELGEFAVAVPTGAVLLLETGDRVLLEDRYHLLLDSLAITGAAVLTATGTLLVGSMVKSVGVRWLVLASIFFDSGTEYKSSGTVQHPSRIYQGLVESWGSLDRSIATPAGLPQISDARIRIADTSGVLRDLLAYQTPRRRLVELKMLQEGAKESEAPLLYVGEMIDFEFGRRAVELTLRDRTFAWIDEPIPSIINRTNFPELGPGNDEAFFPIINGIVVSPSANPEGVVPLPHIGWIPATGDRYALAAHPVWDVVAIYRKRVSGSPQATEWVVVSPTEYNIRVVARTIDTVNYNLTFLDFITEQPDGTEIRADVKGIYFRGGWNGYDAAGYDPILRPYGPQEALRNPIDFFINMTFLVLKKAGQDANWDAGQIMAIRDKFETLAYKCDGAITEGMTCREFLGRFLPNFELDLYCTKQGKIALNFTDTTDPSRPTFTEGRHILRDSFRERIANPTLNRARFRYQHNHATGEWAAQEVFDNALDQTTLGQVEEANLDLWFIRDAATASAVTTRRMNFLAIGSFRQEFQLPAPEVADTLELSRLVGITHRGGLESGGYVNKEVKVTNLILDLDRLTMTVRTILRVPQHLARVTLGQALLTGDGTLLARSLGEHWDFFDRTGALVLNTASCMHEWIACTDPAYLGIFQIHNTKLRMNSLGGGTMMATLDIPAAWTNQYCEMVFDIIVSSGDVAISGGPAVRCNGNTWPFGAGYGLRYTLQSPSPGSIGLFRMAQSGSQMQSILITSVAGFLTTGDRLRLEAIGTTLRALKNGVLLFEATEATIASGKPGLSINADGSDDWTYWTLWEAGTLP